MKVSTLVNPAIMAAGHAPLEVMTAEDVCEIELTDWYQE